MTMTREQMLEYITAYESGDPVKDFYTRDQIQKWLYEFCLDRVQMKPLQTPMPPASMTKTETAAGRKSRVSMPARKTTPPIALRRRPGWRLSRLIGSGYATLNGGY